MASWTMYSITSVAKARKNPAPIKETLHLLKNPLLVVGDGTLLKGMTALPRQWIAHLRWGSDLQALHRAQDQASVQAADKMAKLLA